MIDKGKDNKITDKRRVVYGLCGAIGGAVINFVLGLTKLFIGLVTNSISIFFDAVNNLTDIVGGACGAVGIGVARRKPTNKYPNGFGRMEYIMTFVITMITLVIGGLFIFYSIERLVYPFPVFFSWVYFGVLASTVFVKVAMAIGYHLLWKRTDSDVMKALAIDSIMDSLITGSTVVCYGLCIVTNTTIDAVCGIIIGVVIMVSAVKMLINTIKHLLGYNVDIDLDAVRDELINKLVFTNIERIRMTDYGKDDREIYVFGSFNADKRKELENIENIYHVKIYVATE